MLAAGPFFLQGFVYSVVFTTDVANPFCSYHVSPR